MNVISNKNIFDHFEYSKDRWLITDYLKWVGKRDDDDYVFIILSMIMFDQELKFFGFNELKNLCVKSLSMYMDKDESYLAKKTEFVTLDLLSSEEFEALKNKISLIVTKIKNDPSQMKNGLTTKFPRTLVNKSSLCGSINNFVELEGKKLDYNLV